MKHYYDINNSGLQLWSVPWMMIAKKVKMSIDDECKNLQIESPH